MIDVSSIIAAFSAAGMLLAVLQHGAPAGPYALLKMKTPDVTLLHGLGDCGFKAIPVADAYKRVGSEGHARYAAIVSVRVAASKPLSNADTASLYRSARIEVHFDSATGALSTLASQLGGDPQHTQGMPMIFLSDAPVSSVRCSSVSDS